MAHPLFIANPSRRRRKRKAKRRSYAVNPAPRRRKRRAKRRTRAFKSYRRNPSPRVRRAVAGLTRGKGALKIGEVIMPAIGVGVGAVGAEVIMGYAPLPAAVKTGPVKHLTKAALSIGVGALISRYGNKKLGAMIALGGSSIAVHDFAREQALKFMPKLQLGEYMDGMGYYNPAMSVDGLGEYLSGDAPAMLNYDDALDVANQQVGGFDYSMYDDAVLSP